MDQYLIHDNMARPFLVNVDTNNKIVYVHCINESEDYDYDSDEDSYDEEALKRYYVNPMLTYNYDEIFVGDHEDNYKNYGYDDSLGNNILVGLGNNIYIHIGGCIKVFKTLARVERYFSPIGNNDVPYPYFADEADNVYCESSCLIIKKYYKDGLNDVEDRFCGHLVEMNKLTLEHTKFRHIQILEREYSGIYNNLIEKPKRSTMLEMFMCISYFLKNNNIIIDKHIMVQLMNNYRNYLININILSQCCQAIEYLDDTNMELYLYSSTRYGKAIKYIFKFDEKPEVKLLLNVINADPNTIKYILQLNLPTNLLYDLCIVAVTKNPNVIKYCRNELFDHELFNHDMMSKLRTHALKMDGGAIKHFLKEEITQELVDVAVLGGLCNLECMPSTFVQDWMHDVVLIKFPFHVRHIPKATRQQWLFAINKDPYLFKLMPNKYKTSDLCNEYVKKYPSNFYGLPKKYINVQMCIDLVKQKPKYAQKIPDDIKNDPLYIKSLKTKTTKKPITKKPTKTTNKKPTKTTSKKPTKTATKKPTKTTTKKPTKTTTKKPTTKKPTK